MRYKDFFKCYGAERRNDQLICFSDTYCLLIFGYGVENGQGYTYRKYYDHKPSLAELKTDIEGLVNKHTDSTVISQFEWNGYQVWLSMENQFNFKAAYDLALQSGGATLPIKFKLGEYEDGTPAYFVFEDMDTFTDFYTKAIQFINSALNDGWVEKDNIDYQALLNTADK